MRRHFPALCPRTFVAQSSLSLPSMLLGLKGAKCLDGAVLISSLWSGHLPKDAARISEMTEMGIGTFMFTPPVMRPWKI